MRLKEVVYTISPFETTVLTGVFKDVPQKLHKLWAEVRAAALQLICSARHLPHNSFVNSCGF